MTKLTFLGTGTSQGVPVIACGCWVCSSDDSRDKRLRTSAFIEHNGVRIVIDAGPDFRQQMLREQIKKIDALLLTHEHKDHIGGIDDVRPLNYKNSSVVDIYGLERVLDVVQKDYDYAFNEDKLPGVLDLQLHSISGDSPFDVKGVEVTPIKGMHYKLPVLGYKIGGIAYITDFNYISDEEIEKIKGVEVLVINALRHEHHLSHFTVDEALHISYLVQPQKTYLTHISHQMGRYADESSKLPDNVMFAYDGLTIETLE